MLIYSVYTGTGKTALMAKLAYEMGRRDLRRPVIIRFCGTSIGGRYKNGKIFN